MPRTASTSLSCDIFCNVIDNFGDIGVCWRLARQLHAEHGWRVRLWVDDVDVFCALCPSADHEASQQIVDGVTVARWAGDPEPRVQPADVVIEAFACNLPAGYFAAMAERAPRVIWLNLEYLSAEDWVAEFHLGTSPHPRRPLTKTFFFPGLGPGTGGVLKERGLDDARRRFQASDSAQAAWRAALGIPAPSLPQTTISLFSYENPAVGALLGAWSDGPQHITLLVPPGRISAAVAQFLDLPDFAPGRAARRGRLQAYAVPFTDQAAYDRLLWACDLNFVRGEDSFVRAQWAEKPFVWHIYPQADAAHLPKLQAALGHYARTLAPAERTALERFWHAWNGNGTPAWTDFWQYRDSLARRAADWAAELAKVGDLTGNLVEFCKNQLK